MTADFEMETCVQEVFWECSQAPYLEGSTGCRTGQRGKAYCEAAVAEASASPQEAWDGPSELSQINFDVVISISFTFWF